MSLRLFSILLRPSRPLYAPFLTHLPGRRTVALTSSQGATASAYLYEEVDIHPSFPGGDHKMYSFINSERRYPAKAYDAGIEGACS